MTTGKNEPPIFRSEALQHKRENWLGSSRLHIPSGLSVCLLAGFIAFCFILSIIFFASYSERVNVVGAVVYDPPVLSLIASGEGVITSSSASEGKRIKRGQRIFSVSGDIQTRLGATSVKTVALLKKQRDALVIRREIAVDDAEEKKNYLIQKIENKQQEIDSVQNVIILSEKQNEWFRQKTSLYSRYMDKGMALDSELTERTKDYYLASTTLASARVKRVTLLGELLDLKNRKASVSRELAEKVESFSIDAAGIDQKILNAEKNKEYLMLAPFDGMITSVIAHSGERVTAGQRIAVLIPQGAVARVELLSPSDSLGEVTGGQHVKMRIAAYPYQWYGKISGVIETVSAAPVNITLPAQQNDENMGKGLFRIVVRPVPTEQQKNISLLPGMAVETQIYVKTRKIYAWLFMPVRRAYERATDSME